ncbi:hypothetical protein GCM10023187_40760 [Nibrella viscosa]|uniref:Uncharacterized protein n=1 Tax=Nibrella viscosa TaxID=1084524 RepID=A0ABP8KR44_9BACT
MTLSLIAPYAGALPIVASMPTTDAYEQTIAEIQRFRGRIYVQDQAIPASALDRSGRHYTKLDYASYHVIIRNQEGAITGVMRIPTYVSGAAVWFLQLYHVLERMEPGQKALYSFAIQHFIDQSASKYPFIVEPGGWAVDRQISEKLTGTVLAASCWAFCQLIGGAVAVATATVKHNAADLLRMMGGINCLQGTTNARFFDSFHQCELELIFFQSDKINPRFAAMVEAIKEQWQQREVVAA